MFQKLKLKISNTIRYMQFLSTVIMSLAAILGMFEITQKSYQRVIINPQNSQYTKLVNDSGSSVRNEEESDSNYISYSEVQRTYPRSGRY